MLSWQWGRLFAPQEVAWITTAALTSSSLVLILQYLTADDADKSSWETQSWKRTTCQILQTGITYSGDCTEDSRRAFQYINCHELLSNNGNQPTWHGVNEHACAEDADWAWSSMHSGRKLHALEDRVLANRACADAFLPWALVRAEGSDFDICAYKTGVPEGSSTEAFRDAFSIVDTMGGNSSSVVCWYLDIGRKPGLPRYRRMPSCHVAALEDPANKRAEKESQASASADLTDPPARMLLYLAIFAGTLALLSATALQWCIRTGISKWSELHHHKEEASVEPSVTASRRDDLRSKWNVFQQSVLDTSKGEYQLVPSDSPLETRCPSREALDNP